MFNVKAFKKQLFGIAHEQFEACALDLFRYQATENKLYAKYLRLLGVVPQTVNCIERIPFLPIEVFKTNELICPDGAGIAQKFTSSGTTGSITSTHLVHDIALYEASFTHAFELFYGSISNYCILALLPAYLDRSGSSLVYMAQQLIQQSGHKLSGFYLNDYPQLAKTLAHLAGAQQATVLLGVSFALWDLAEYYPQELPNTIIMETGGMKGRRPELIREELHEILCNAFGVSAIHSEYGMTELLSQAYSSGNGVFTCPPWMRVLVREVNDPFTWASYGETGGICVVDLANIHSCAFIATQDLGRLHANGTFEPLGRFDNSDLRGCNLLLG